MVVLRIMELNKTHHRTSKWRSIIGIVAIFCIVLSSCAVKASIKNHLGVQHTATQNKTSNNQGKSFLSSSAIDCFYTSSADAINIQNADVKFAGSTIAILALCTFTFFFGFNALKKEDKYPLYNSDKISGSLPIFLQYRKLII